MLTSSNLSKLYYAINTWYRANHPHQSVTPLELEKVIASAIVASGPNRLHARLQQSPVLWDATTCRAISDELARRGHPVLPAQFWLWPLPEHFDLQPEERMGLWHAAVDHARNKGTISGSLRNAFRAVEPFVVPAGGSGWYIAPESPVPFAVCAAVFAPATVTVDGAIIKAILSSQSRPQSEQCFIAGLCALRDRRYDEAMTQLRVAVADDHVAALLNLAWLIDEGLAAPRDVGAAAALYERAADLGSLDARHNLANIYANGDGPVAVDLDAAIHHYTIAADAGHAESQSALGRMLWHGQHGSTDRTRAKVLLMQAASAGNGPALNTLGTALDSEQDNAAHAQAVELYRAAVRSSDSRGTAFAYYNLARAYYLGRGVPPNLRMAHRLYRRAAIAGDTDAQFFVARMYARGEGFHVDGHAARIWAERGTEGGNMRAQALLGMLDLDGAGLDAPDPERGVARIQAAVDQWEPSAMVCLAALHQHGRHVERDEDYAEFLISRAAARGHEHAAEWMDARQMEAVQ